MSGDHPIILQFYVRQESFVSLYERALGELRPVDHGWVDLSCMWGRLSSLPFIDSDQSTNNLSRLIGERLF